MQFILKAAKLSTYQISFYFLLFIENFIMVKSELVDKLAEQYQEWAFKDVVFAVNEVINQMTQSLVDHGRVEFRGFGSFRPNWLGPRNAHNPKNGERVITTGKYRVRFRAAKALRDRVNANRHLPIKDGAKRRYDEE